MLRGDWDESDPVSESGRHHPMNQPHDSTDASPFAGEDLHLDLLVVRPAVDSGREIERERSWAFLLSHWALLGIAAASIVAMVGGGVLSESVIVPSAVLIGVVGLLTVAGTFAWRTGRGISRFVLGMLYADSVLMLVFFYLLGEFETPSVGLVLVVIVMAPIYTRKRAAWSIAAVQDAVYLSLLWGRASGGLDWLPYHYRLGADGLSDTEFLMLSSGAFVTATASVAFLAGKASIDILTSREQLTSAVKRQTAALEAATSQLGERARELAQTNMRLRDTNHALGQFNATVSHDLRAPMQTMMVYVDLLEGAENLDDDQREMIESMGGSVERMTRLLEALSYLAKVTHRLGELVPVALDRAADEAVENLSARITGSGAQVEVVRPLPSVMGNPELLGEVLQNLLENAIKYGSAKPRIRVGPAPAAVGRQAFAVEDDGDGIDPEDSEAIFKIFRRLDRHASKEGAGAGLAIVSRIVNAHGGTIRVERGTTLGGARFVVELEAVAATPTG